MSATYRQEIRSSRKARALGTLAGWLMRLWSATLRYHITDVSGVNDRSRPREPVIFALWHDRIFAVPPVWPRTGGKGRRTVVLASASKDGASLAAAMAVFGIQAVHGSSSRRGVAGLVGLRRARREGADACITPDGPKGPRHRFKPGIIKLAESGKVPIIPIHARCQAAWCLPSWDKLILPIPFSRVEVEFGAPLSLADLADEQSFETERARIEQILRDGAGDP